MAASVRPAVEADIPAIARIYAHHVLHGTGTFEAEPPDDAEVARRWSDVIAKRLPWLVAEDAGEVVGYAYASAYRKRIGYRFTVEDSVYVRADWMGAGIGRMLLPALIAEAEALGKRQMIAVIGDSENLASVALHQRFGFREVGVLKAVGYKFGRWLDTIFMQKTLGPS